MELAHCDSDQKAQILDILNEAIVHTTAIYDYQPRPLESMDGWFKSKIEGKFPVVGMFDGDRNLLGFGTYGRFRNWPAYKYSVEHSVYIKESARGKGIGCLLLAELIRIAETQGYHTLVAGIDSGNAISIRLHEKLGFAHSGTIVQAGYKFGRWLDLAFYQKILATPLVATEE